MKIEVDVQLSGIPVQCAVEWDWENVDGLTMIGLGSDDPPTLRLRVTALSPLMADPAPVDILDFLARTGNLPEDICTSCDRPGSEHMPPSYKCPGARGVQVHPNQEEPVLLVRE